MKRIEKARDGRTPQLAWRGPQPRRLTRRLTRFGSIDFDGPEAVTATCLHCADRPCVEFTADEVRAAVGIPLPFHPRRETCAFGALGWDAPTQLPTVDSEKCTGCGVCVRRCPVGAIRLGKGTVEVNTTAPPPHWHAAMTSEDFASSRDSLSAVQVFERSSGEADRLMEQIPTVLAALPRSQGDSRQVAAMVVRNALIGAGMPARAGNTGDTNRRIDVAFGQPGDVTFIVEVDLGAGENLGPIRRVLANYAIITNRERIPKNRLRAAVVTGEYPRTRTDAHEVFADVRKVLGLDIAILPVAYLLLLCAFGFDLAETDFTANMDDVSWGSRHQGVLAGVRQVLGEATPAMIEEHFIPGK
jgi:Fe-S-cluster-containing hydrogenase component 2